MKDIIEQLDNLQIGDLVWWRDEGGTDIVIGMVTQLREDLDGDYTWRADFPQDGEHCYWGEGCHEYAIEGMLGVVCKSEI
jgi:hypothetical protein